MVQFKDLVESLLCDLTDTLILSPLVKGTTLMGTLLDPLHVGDDN